MSPFVSSHFNALSSSRTNFMVNTLNRRPVNRFVAPGAPFRHQNYSIGTQVNQPLKPFGSSYQNHAYNKPQGMMTAKPLHLTSPAYRPVVMPRPVPSSSRSLPPPPHLSMMKFVSDVAKAPLPSPPHLGMMKVVHNPNTDESTKLRPSTQSPSRSSCSVDENLRQNVNKVSTNKISVSPEQKLRFVRKTQSETPKNNSCIHSMNSTENRKTNSRCLSPPTSDEIKSVNLTNYVTTPMSIPRAKMKQIKFTMFFSVEIVESGSPTRFIFQFNQRALDGLMEEMK